MLNPDQQSMAKLKRLVRSLKREGQWGQVFSYGRMANEVTTFADSYWAGWKETRKSSSVGVILLGNHVPYTRKQKIMAKSSAEAELYAAALGASGLKAVVSLLKDLGHGLKPALDIDASTAYVRASLAPARSPRSSPCVGPRTRSHSPCFSAAVAGQGLSCPPRLALAREGCGYHCRANCLCTSLRQLSQGLNETSLLSLLLLHLLQRLMQLLILSPQLSQLPDELFWIHHTLPPVTTPFSGSSLEHWPGDQQCFATRFAEYVQCALLCVRCELCPCDK